MSLCCTNDGTLYRCPNLRTTQCPSVVLMIVHYIDSPNLRTTLCPSVVLMIVHFHFVNLESELPFLFCNSNTSVLHYVMFYSIYIGEAPVAASPHCKHSLLHLHCEKV